MILCLYHPDILCKKGKRHSYCRVSKQVCKLALERLLRKSKRILLFPVLNLQAEKDAFQPVSLFETVGCECPRVELRLIRDASHFSNFDKPEEVARAINEFLGRSSLRRSEGLP